MEAMRKMIIKYDENEIYKKSLRIVILFEKKQILHY